MTQDITTSRSRSLLNMTNIDDAIRASEILSKSGLVPDKFKGRPADILVAMQWGAELGGVQPLQALNGIAVVNGTPSIYGDLGKALIMRQADLSSFALDTTGEGKDMAALCEIGRKKPNGLIHVRRTFTMKDAERAGLGGRGPWKQYPGRMLMWRAFWLAARDIYADVLSGLQGAEELQDLPFEIAAQDKPQERMVDLSAKPKKPKGKVSAVVVEEPESPRPLPKGFSMVETADTKEARFRGEQLLSKNSKELIEAIRNEKQSQGLEAAEFVDLVKGLGAPHLLTDGKVVPSKLSLVDLRDIYCALTPDAEEPDEPQQDTKDEEPPVPF